jgi:uncharacterized secreted protein with C-terminal beta-propeller domain
MGILALILGSALGVTLFSLGGVYFEPIFTNLGPLQRFSSYEELKAFLNTSSQNVQWGGFYRDQITFAIEALDVTTGKAPIPLDYSTTNIQVAGVDEIDVVKTDGEFLYVVSGKSVFIVRAYPAEDADVLSRLDFNKAINGLFVNTDKLVILTGAFNPHQIRFFVEDDAVYDLPSTAIMIYDIANRSTPTLDRNMTVNGSYFNSRMVADYVYVIITQPAYVRDGEVALPAIIDDDRAVTVSATNIYYSNVSDYYYAFTNILAINTQNSEEEATYETVLTGSASNLYVSQTSIYITSFGFEETTTIHKINIEAGDITYVATGNVTGYVLNQFSMDEYQDYFRIATTVHTFSSQTHLYVLNSSLHVVGVIEGIAPGEDLHSARFMGDKCYLVTFKKIDPLFVIDLTDPEAPQILGKLKVPGYSDYLHPYDGTHLIGIGKETVEAKEGDFAWYQGVKISLFDVSDVSRPTELDKTEIGDRGTDSPALSDHKALLFSKDKHLLVLPILLAEIDEAQYPNGVPASAYGNFVWQGAYVLDVSLEHGITVKGTITHMGDNSDLLRSGYYFESSYAVKRAVYVENVLYTISDKTIKLNDLDTLLEINEVELA